MGRGCWETVAIVLCAEVGTVRGEQDGGWGQMRTPGERWAGSMASHQQVKMSSFWRRVGGFEEFLRREGPLRRPRALSAFAQRQVGRLSISTCPLRPHLHGIVSPLCLGLSVPSLLQLVPLFLPAGPLEAENLRIAPDVHSSIHYPCHKWCLSVVF